MDVYRAWDVAFYGVNAEKADFGLLGLTVWKRSKPRDYGRRTHVQRHLSVMASPVAQ